MTDTNGNELARPRNSDGKSRRTVLKRGTQMGAAALGVGLLGGAKAELPAAQARTIGEDPALPQLVLHKFVDPLPRPPTVRPRRGAHRSELTIRMRTVEKRLHSELPPSRLWTYGGHFPGPVIEVRSGERLWINWTNEIEGKLPLVAVEVADDDDVPGRPPGALPTNYPGRDGLPPLTNVAAAPPWLSVHVHGSHVSGGNDGWPENAVMPGYSQLSEYPNDQPSTTLWYHDHAMLMTRFTLMSGLIGMYLIRDDEEAALGLPSGRFEMPLIFCDRNFDIDADGHPNGRLLHKIQLGQVEPPIVVPFAGPYSLVNGTVWPYLEVEPRCYRFRMLNASNGRVLQFVVIDEAGEPVPGVLRVIGTDGGLLGEPKPVEGAMVLSPAERADVLVDFSAFAGQRLKLVNTRPGVPPGEPVPEDGIPEPDVMEFRVAHRRVRDSFRTPKTLSPSFEQLKASDLPDDAQHRLIVLTSPGAPADPEMWEMAEVDPDTVTIPGDGIIQVEDENAVLRTYKRIAGTYGEKTNYEIPLGSWEKWTFIDLGGPPHPMHLHLVRFQPLGRDYYDITGWDVRVRGTTKPLKYMEQAPLEPHEQGWKDVIRVAAGLRNSGRGEVVTIGGQFGTGNASGRYVYHCHLLDHEHDMMRPFVVLPPAIMALHGHGSSAAPADKNIGHENGHEEQNPFDDGGHGGAHGAHN